MLSLVSEKTMKSLQRVGALVLAATFAACPVSEADADAGDTLPNVVFILADDIGWGDLGSYGGGPGTGETSVTPNLDQLAAEGMIFTDAHTPAALCAPTRFSMMTGSNPYRNGRAGGTWNIHNSSAFSTNRQHTTVGDVMQAAGYYTGFFGKMHFGGSAYDTDGNVIRKSADIQNIDMSRKIDDSIDVHGFDYSYGLQSGIQHEPYAYFENGMFAPIDPNKPADNTSTHLIPRTPIVGPNGTSITAGPNPALADVDYDSSQVGIQLSNKAVDFIDNALTNHGDKPFMMYYASQAIHVPHTPPIDFDGDPSTIDEPVDGQTGGVTSDMIYELDLQVGRIMQKLEDEGIADNTLIIFTSDNGGLDPVKTNSVYGDPNHDATGDLRGWKSSVDEGGHRVPFIAKWGDGTEAGSVIAPGSVHDGLMLSQDWVASMYDLTAQDMNALDAMDSATLFPTLLGQTSDPVRDSIIIRQAGSGTTRPGDDRTYGAVRQGDFLLLVDRDTREALEFYDLSTDLVQATNLISDPTHSGLIADMTDLYDSFADENDPRTTIAFDSNNRTPGLPPAPGVDPPVDDQIAYDALNGLGYGIGGSVNRWHDSGHWNTTIDGSSGPSGSDAGDWVDGSNALLSNDAGAGTAVLLLESDATAANVTVLEGDSFVALDANSTGSTLTITESLDIQNDVLRPQGGTTIAGTFDLVNGAASPSNGQLTIGSGAVLAANVSVGGNATLRVLNSASSDFSSAQVNLAGGQLQHNAAAKTLGALTGSGFVDDSRSQTDGNLTVLSIQPGEVDAEGIGLLTTDLDTLTMGPGSHEFDLNRASDVLSNDAVQADFDLVLGGDLVVSLLDGSDPLQSGDSFDLFEGGAVSGSFSSVQLPTLVAGLSWDSSALESAGVIAVTGVAALLGDYDNDGVVDAADYVVWRQGYGSTGPFPPNADPDGNSDGVVDAADFTIWRDNLSSSASSSTAAVPEPGGCVALVVSNLLLVLCRRCIR